MPNTYKTGIYSPIRGGEAKYPSHWRGCFGAWCPSLGQTGNIIRDQTAYKNHGVFGGGMLPDTAWVMTPNGYALNFDGVNNSITLSYTIPYPNLSSGGTRFSNNPTTAMSIWVRPTSSTGTRVMFSARNSAAGNSQYSLRSNGTAYEFYVQDTGVISATASAAGTVQLNTWTHLCGVKIRDTLFLYINGAQAATATPGTNYGSFTFDGLYIGGTVFISLQSPYQGLLDDIRIYSKAPTTTEITQLASQRGISYTPKRNRSRLSIPQPPQPNYLVARIGGS